MSYSKPMVTIELDEYEELKRKSRDLENDSHLYRAKQVIAELLNSKSDIYKAIFELKQRGIDFSVNKMGRDDIAHPENIIIKYK